MTELPSFLAGYIPVKQRIHDMREAHPDWGVSTVLTLEADYWQAVSTISDETGRLISTGNAVEKNTKPFDAEKAETSAVGRALVFAGWTDSLELSQEELERSGDVPKPAAKKLDVTTVQAKKRLVQIFDGSTETAASFWELHQSMTPAEIVQLAEEST